MLGVQAAGDGSDLLSYAAQAALCIPVSGIWDLCMPDVLRKQQFLQGHGVFRNPANIQSQISESQYFCGGRWVQGNVCACMYLRRSCMGRARKFHFYIITMGFFVKKMYVIYLPEK